MGDQDKFQFTLRNGHKMPMVGFGTYAPKDVSIWLSVLCITVMLKKFGLLGNLAHCLNDVILVSLFIRSRYIAQCLSLCPC